MIYNKSNDRWITSRNEKLIRTVLHIQSKNAFIFEIYNLLTKDETIINIKSCSSFYCYTICCFYTYLSKEQTIISVVKVLLHIKVIKESESSHVQYIWEVILLFNSCTHMFFIKICIIIILRSLIYSNRELMYWVTYFLIFILNFRIKFIRESLTESFKRIYRLEINRCVNSWHTSSIYVWRISKSIF